MIGVIHLLNINQFYEELAQGFGEEKARVLVKVLTAFYEELKNSVTKTEKDDIKEMIRELKEAQKRTEGSENADT